jgi:crotonobetainyl-CoA:carnitine CoA-transferase CaiB-like acyl-CoA transferase
MLDGYLVLDCTGRLGWLAARLLADLGADVVKIELPGAPLDDVDWQANNVNKRLLTLDWGQKAGKAAFDRLVKKADFLFETAQPGSKDAKTVFSPTRLRRLNRDLIHVSITPFGRSGPRAEWRGSDMELMAAGGAMGLAGEPGGLPVRVTAPQAPAWASSQAAVGAMVALAHRATSGRGQHVDVSAQASVVAAIANAPPFWDIAGDNPTRDGSFITGRSVHGGRFRVFWPCKDGHVNFILYGGVAGKRTNLGLTSWMTEKGSPLGVLAGIEWDKFDPTQLNQAQIDELEKPIGDFIRTLTKREFLEGTFAREMLGYPVSTMADISTDPQLEARGFWQEVQGPNGKTARHTGAVAIIDGKRPPIRHPVPGRGQHSRAVLSEQGFTATEIDALISAGVVEAA